MKMQAVWQGAVLAESESTIVVEGNHYFPREAIRTQFFRENDQHTVCPWKGTASYYDLVVGEAKNAGAAWYYPNTSEAARRIENYVAFWRGVEVRPTA